MFFLSGDDAIISTLSNSEEISSEHFKNISKKLDAIVTAEKELKDANVELSENFKYARVWGPSSKYPGEKVGRMHVLKDEDVVEIHIK